MAKKLKDEDLVLNIIINGNKSKKEMNELERAITDTNREINTLKKAQKDLIAQGKKETEAYKATVVAIEQKNKAVLLAEARLTQLRKGMKLTEMSTADLRKEMRRLKALQDTSAPNSDNWKQYGAQLDEVKNRLAELGGKAETTGLNLRSVADKFNHYIGVVTAGVVTLMGLITGINQIVTTFAEFDDKVADVQKTTGLAKDEVMELNEEFKKIDTRTAQEDLLGLARVAGKLGLSAKDDILGFVKASDQIGVALSEDLGGDVEEAINSVGKLVDIFDLKREFGIEQSLLKVGSAINELGAGSTANEGYLVNFTNRMAGVAPLAGITIDQVLGLGATLDQFGQTAEVSSTALSKLFIKMSEDSATYAKYSGQSIDEFKKNLETDFMGTFIKVLEGVKKSSGGINELVGTLGELGLDGGRVVGVLGVLANNTGALKTQLDLANQSFIEGTSLTEEFGIKNETAAAQLEKARKNVYNLTVELGQKLFGAVAVSTNGLSYLVKGLSALIGFIIEHKKVITITIAALIAYNAVLLIQSLRQKAVNTESKINLALFKLQYFWMQASTAATHLLNVATALYRGNLALARAELIAFNTILKASPLGAAIAGIVAVGAAIYIYSQRLTEAQKVQKQLNDIQAEANKTTSDAKNRIAALEAILKDEVATQNEKIDAIKQLRELMPEHLKAYTDEQILAGNATKAISLYINELERKARVDASVRRLSELDAEKDDLKRKKAEGWKSASFGEKVEGSFNGFGKNAGAEGYLKILDQEEKDIDKAQEIIRQKMQRDLSTNLDMTTVGGMQSYADELSKSLPKLKKGTAEYKKQLDEIKQLNTKIAMMKANPNSTTAINTNTGTPAAGGKSDKERKAEAAAEKRATEQKLAELKKREEAERKYRLKLVNPEAEEIQQEKEAHNQRLERAGLFGKDREKMTDEHLKALETLEAIHRDKLANIDAKLIAQHLQQKQQAFETELAQLRYKNHEELASINSLEKAKEILSSRIDAKELSKITNLKEARKVIKEAQLREENAMTVKYGEDLMVQLKTAIDSGQLNFDDLKLSDKILSTEEYEVLKAQFLKLSEMMAGLKNPEGAEDVKSGYSFGDGKTDILGFAPEDWDYFFENLSKGKFGVGEMVLAVGALTQAWSIYDQFKTQSESKQLKQTQDSANSQKARLQDQLDKGRISQKKYTAEVAKLDADLDKKKLKIEEDQAARQKIMAIGNIISSTAQAIMSIWAQVPKFDFGLSAGLLTGIVGAVGAAQLGMVMGLEQGGFVTRAQDGKQFKAKNKGLQRGYMDETSVLVSENGTEFVASAAAVANPEIKQVLDMIDSAQRNGNVNTLSLEKMMYTSSVSRRVNGKESGGYVSDQTAKSSAQTTGLPPELLAMVKQNNELFKKLSQQLEKPITAKVGLLGKDGFIKQMDDYTTIVDNSNL